MVAVAKSKVEEQVAAEEYKEKYVEKVVTLNRVSKVVKGGRIFSFAALGVVGDPVQHRVGFCYDGAREVPTGIKKAMEGARRDMINIELNGDTLWYPTIGYHGATKVIMRPASEGTGVIAGGAMRAVFEVLGVKNVLAKCIGSTNPINVVRATISGLMNMKSPEMIAEKRGKSVRDVWDR